MGPKSCSDFVFFMAVETKQQMPGWSKSGSFLPDEGAAQVWEWTELRHASETAQSAFDVPRLHMIHTLVGLRDQFMGQFMSTPNGQRPKATGCSVKCVGIHQIVLEVLEGWCYWNVSIYRSSVFFPGWWPQFWAAQNMITMDQPLLMPCGAPPVPGGTPLVPVCANSNSSQLCFFPLRRS